jgi:hypothetical protein
MKDAWIQNRKVYIVIDSKGNDCIERKDTLMEHFVALFGISIFDIFIVKIYNNEVDWYYGSQFNVLKICLRIH